MKIAFLVGAVIVMLCQSGYAGEGMMPPVYQGSKELEQLKSLTGRWEGKSLMEGQEQVVAVEYRVISNGSVVMESLFPGTPQEMVTTYYDRDGKLAMTHYCALGNKPEMSLSGSTEREIVLDLREGSIADPNQQMHMHSLKIMLDDADHFSQEWTSYSEGKSQAPHRFEFARVR